MSPSLVDQYDNAAEESSEPPEPAEQEGDEGDEEAPAAVAPRSPRRQTGSLPAGWQNPAEPDRAPAPDTGAGPEIIGPDGRPFQHPTPMDTYKAQVRQYYAALPPALKGQFLLQQLKLSQAEAIRLQHMQNALGAIRANPNLSEEDKADAMTLLQTGINPLAIRQGRAKMLESQLIHQQQLALIKQAGDLNEANAKNISRGVAVEPHPQPGQSYYYWNPRTGKIEELGSSHRDQEARAQALAADHALKLTEMQTKSEEAYRQHDEKLWHDQYGKIKGDVDKKISSGEVELGTEEGTFRYGKNGPWIQAPQGTSARDWLLQRELAGHDMSDAGPAAYVERKAAQRAARRPGAAVQPPPSGVPAPTTPASNAAAQPPSELDQRVSQALQGRNAAATRGAAQQRQGRIEEARRPIAQQLAFAMKMYGPNSPTTRHMQNLHDTMGLYAPGEAMPPDVYQRFLESKAQTEQFRRFNRP